MGDKQSCVTKVTLKEQLGVFERDWYKALCRLRTTLFSEGYLQHIHDLARERLIAGYAAYGDAACHWDKELIDSNADEELGDYVVYHTIGGCANERMAARVEDMLDAADALEALREAESEGTISLDELRARLAHDERTS